MRSFCVTTVVVSAAACDLMERASGLDPLESVPELPFTETAVIGGSSAQGPDAFGSIRGGTFIPGTDLVAVIDGTAQEISYFTQNGAHVRTIGRRGGGPGESLALRTIRGRSNGGLCSWDVQQRRVTEFDASGEVVQTGYPDTGPLQELVPGLVSFLDDCAYVIRDTRSEMELRDAPEGMRRDTVRFFSYSPGGVLLDTVATAHDAERWLRNRDGSWGRETPIFGNELMSFVSGRELWVGVNDSLRWSRIDLMTGASETVRLSVRVRSASTDDIEAERQRRLDKVQARPALRGMLGDGRSLADVFEEIESEAILAVPSNTTIPAYDRAVGGADGSVWLREFPMPSDARVRWMLITEGPTLAGQLWLPRADSVLAGDRSKLLLLMQDSMDAPVLRVLERVGS